MATTGALEEDCCRVCRSEGTANDPLFYPCKCSGSIRYVHQDCLLEWLNHSHKKHCELCKTPFQFTNLYDPAMPSRLPAHQLLRKLLIDIKKTFFLFLRWSLVSFVWLCWLPYCTRHIWRSTIRIGDQLTSNSSGHLHDLANMTVSPLADLVDVSDNSSAILNETSTRLQTFLPFNPSTLTGNLLINKVLTEIFEGQVITSVIIIVFVVVFLIREWIIQNNAHLLDEAPEFLAAPDEARRQAMRLAALPPQLNEPSPTLSALDSPSMGHTSASFEQPGEDPLHASHQENDHNSTVQLEGIENSDRRSNYSDDLLLSTSTRDPQDDSSDWETLRLQATQSSRQKRNKIEPLVEQSDPRHNGQAVIADVKRQSDVGDGSSGDTTNEESTLTAAELKALRRQAVLRATSQRINRQAVECDADDTAVRECGGEQTDRQSRSQELDYRLAMVDNDNDGTPQELRHKYARQRSTERKIWEESEQYKDEEYPDSPVPAPRPDRYIEDTLRLPETNMTLLDLSTTPVDNAAWQTDEIARKVEIAVSSGHPRFREMLDSNDEPPTRLSEESSGHASTMTPDQLEVLLSQIRDAVSAQQRGQIANAAIQVCIDVARRTKPDGAFDRSDAIYRETIRQVGTIAMVANRHGVEGVVDVQKAFRLADEPAHTTTEPDVNEAHYGIEAAHILPPANDELDLVENNNLDFNANVVREDVMDDDDIDGLLELIGVRGPIVALLQNSMLVVVMVTSFIVFGICLPYMFGKCVTAVMQSPRVYLLQMPKSIARMLILQLAGTFKVASRGAKILLRPVLRHSRVVKYSFLSIQRAALYFEGQAREVSFEPLQIYGVRSMERIHHVVTSVGGASEEVATILADYGVHNIFKGSGILLAGRFVTVLNGYLSLTLVGVSYIKANQRLTTGEQGKQIELAVRSFLRQAGFVIKFVVILGIELVVFPFYCGLLLNVVFTPFFPMTDLQERISFFVQYPFTSLFLHWFVGTVYIFNFALFVSMCREIVRPGLLFFIRDPNDPTFNPIKDILERSIRSQMRKIGISIVIYGSLVTLAFGSVVWSVAYMVKGLLPLNWRTSEPLFEVPFDLLLFQILLPLTFRFVKPHKKLKSIWTMWFTTTAGFLRLSSFVMGNRIADEEGHVSGRASLIAQLWYRPPSAEDPGFIRDGSFRRVPATDSLPMRHGKDMIMLVTEDNTLVTTADEEDETREDENYTIVYAPPQLRSRIYIFLVTMWLFAAALCIACTVVPLLLGRRLFNLITPGSQMHDLFAYLYGAYALGAFIWTVLKFGMVATMFKRFATYLSQLCDNPRQISRNVQSVLNLSLRWLYLLSTLSVIIPILLGLALETYVIIPLGIWLSPNYVPNVHLAHDWIVGLVYVKIIGRIAMMLPTNALGQALNNTMRNDWRRGWRNPDLNIATKKLIVPAISALIAALVVPLTVGALAQRTMYHEAPKEISILIYRMSYPAALITVMLSIACRFIAVLITRWRATVRDALYLQGRQLHNFGEPHSLVKPAARHATHNDHTEPSAESSSIESDLAAAQVLEDLVQAVEQPGGDVA